MSSRAIESFLPAKPRAVDPTPRAAEERRGFGSALDQALQVDVEQSPVAADAESGDCDLPAYDDGSARESLHDEAESPADGAAAEGDEPIAEGAAADGDELLLAAAATVAAAAPPVNVAVATAGAETSVLGIVADVQPQPAPGAELPAEEMPAAGEPTPLSDVGEGNAVLASPAAAAKNALVASPAGAAHARGASSSEEKPTTESSASEGESAGETHSKAATDAVEASSSRKQATAAATSHTGVANGKESAAGRDGDPAAAGPRGEPAPAISAIQPESTSDAAPTDGEPARTAGSIAELATAPAPAASDANPATSGSAAPLARLAPGRTLNAAPQRGEAEAVEHVDRDRFLGRVEGAIRTAQQRDGRVQVRLSPPELGSLRIELTIEQGVLSARLEAETPAARKLLLDNLPALRERLAQQDVRVDRFDVDVRREGGGSGGGPQDRPAGDPAPRQGDGRRERAEMRQPTATRRVNSPKLNLTPNSALDVRV
jgi:flagellar hook-length control protein FliK